MRIGKQNVCIKISPIQLTGKVRFRFERMVDFMNNGASLDGFILRMKVADLDRKRGQNLAVTEPEFAQLIDYAGPN